MKKVSNYYYITNIHLIYFIYFFYYFLIYIFITFHFTFLFNFTLHFYLLLLLNLGFSSLNVSTIHNVIISYNQKHAGNPNEVIQKIQNIWQTLEDYAEEKKILQIGLSDVEENTFLAIYDWAKVKPSIIQINLATCCVVPPTLQAFCKENEVQLLTHSDPSGKLKIINIINIQKRIIKA